jgi:hypothetical protein
MPDGAISRPETQEHLPKIAGGRVRHGPPAATGLFLAARPRHFQGRWLTTADSEPENQRHHRPCPNGEGLGGPTWRGCSWHQQHARFPLRARDRSRTVCTVYTYLMIINITRTPVWTMELQGEEKREKKTLPLQQTRRPPRRVGGSTVSCQGPLVPACPSSRRRLPIVS